MVKKIVKKYEDLEQKPKEVIKKDDKPKKAEPTFDPKNLIKTLEGNESKENEEKEKKLSGPPGSKIKEVKEKINPPINYSNKEAPVFRSESLKQELFFDNTLKNIQEKLFENQYFLEIMLIKNGFKKAEEQYELNQTLENTMLKESAIILADLIDGNKPLKEDMGVVNMNRYTYTYLPARFLTEAYLLGIEDLEEILNWDDELDEAKFVKVKDSLYAFTNKATIKDVKDAIIYYMKEVIKFDEEQIRFLEKAYINEEEGKIGSKYLWNAFSMCCVASCLPE